MAIDATPVYGPTRSGAALFAALNPSLAAQGIISESFARSGQNFSGSLMITGVVHFNSIALIAGQSFSSAAIIVQTGGNTVTTSKIGLYSKTGSRLAITADQGTAWESAGAKGAAFLSPYVVPVSDMYYVAAIAISGVTMPTVIRGTGTTPGLAANVAINSGLLPMGAQTGQTDLPVSAVIGVGTTANTFGLYVALY